jgi:hypothetical protein
LADNVHGGTLSARYGRPLAGDPQDETADPQGNRSLHLGEDRALAALSIGGQDRHHRYPVARLLGTLEVSPDRAGSGVVVEVYPAAALRAWGFSPEGYKGLARQEIRERLVSTFFEEAKPWVTVSSSALSGFVYDDNCFDAFVASLVARAWATGPCWPVPADDIQTASTRAGSRCRDPARSANYHLILDLDPSPRGCEAAFPRQKSEGFCRAATGAFHHMGWSTQPDGGG